MFSRKKTTKIILEKKIKKIKGKENTVTIYSVLRGNIQL
jgi:hypothetical protein